ncbi:MAG: RNA polymerase sigma factor, partial [Planctomycetota bacterium JB042]
MTSSEPGASSPNPPIPDVLNTADLLSRVRSGDEGARDELFRRYRVPLERFLHGRLPPAARGVLDTQDATQEVCIKVFRSLERFDHRGIGSFWAYLRQAAMNWVRDLAKTPGKLRRAGSLPEETHAQPAGPGRSPLAEVLTGEDLAAFEAAVGKLEEKPRLALLMRLELDL